MIPLAGVHTRTRTYTHVHARTHARTHARINTHRNKHQQTHNPHTCKRTASTQLKCHQHKILIVSQHVFQYFFVFHSSITSNGVPRAKYVAKEADISAKKTYQHFLRTPCCSCIQLVFVGRRSRHRSRTFPREFQVMEFCLSAGNVLKKQNKD